MTSPSFADWARAFAGSPLTAPCSLPPFPIDSNVAALNGQQGTPYLSSHFEPALRFQLSEIAAVSLMFSDEEIEVAFKDTTGKSRQYARHTDSSGDLLLMARDAPHFVGFPDQHCDVLWVQWVTFPRHNRMHYLHDSKFSFSFGGRQWEMQGNVSKPDGLTTEQILELGRTEHSTFHVKLSVDRGGVTGEQANVLLHRLSSALTFAGGHYVQPVFAAGHQGADPVWVRFGSDIRTPRAGARWADNIQTADFDEFLGKFMGAADDESRGNSIASTVFLYSQCVSGLPSLRPAVLLGQSALEDLARWVLLDEEELQPKFVREVRALDLFDLLFSVLRTDKEEVAKACWPPDAEPTFFETLKNLTEVRNTIAHRGTGKTKQEIFAALTAVNRLLEISLLASIGYTGRFCMRGSSPIDFKTFLRV